MNFWMSYICDVSHHLNYFLLKAECFHIFCFRSQLYQNSSFRHPRSYRTSSLRSCRFPFPSCQACCSKNPHHPISYSPVLRNSIFLVSSPFFLASSPLPSWRFPYSGCQVRYIKTPYLIIPIPTPQSFSKLKVSIFLVSGVNAVQQPLPLQQGSNFFLKEEFIFSSKQNTSQRNNLFYHLGILYNPWKVNAHICTSVDSYICNMYSPTYAKKTIQSKENFVTLSF